ncbi:MAG TPA: hypothetical protein VHX64_01505, partial [Caulobacteraceae bacterium]|nr:hypothetical protein [Caulobacteraceae bacterium]
LVGFLKGEFREEPGVDGLPPVESEGSPAFAWPYERSREALMRLARSQEIDPWRGHVLRYLTPEGRRPMATLGSGLTLLPRGFGTRPYRAINSLVATLVEGRARAIIGGEPFEIGPRDLIAVPGWTPYVLEAVEESVLFAFSDLATYEALGLWREERMA